jgi:hypothetical protein
MQQRPIKGQVSLPTVSNMDTVHSRYSESNTALHNLKVVRETGSEHAIAFVKCSGRVVAPKESRYTHPPGQAMGPEQPKIKGPFWVVLVFVYSKGAVIRT